MGDGAAVENDDDVKSRVRCLSRDVGILRKERRKWGRHDDDDVGQSLAVILRWCDSPDTNQIAAFEKWFNELRSEDRPPRGKLRHTQHQEGAESRPDGAGSRGTLDAIGSVIELLNCGVRRIIEDPTDLLVWSDRLTCGRGYTARLSRNAGVTPARITQRFQRVRGAALAGATVCVLEDASGEATKIFLSDEYSKGHLVGSELLGAYSQFIKTHPDLRLPGLNAFWEIVRRRVAEFNPRRASPAEQAVIFLILDVLNLASWSDPEAVMSITRGDRTFFIGSRAGRCPMLRRAYAKVEANSGNVGPYADFLSLPHMQHLEGLGLLWCMSTGFTKNACHILMAGNAESPMGARERLSGVKRTLQFVCSSLSDEWYHDRAHAMVLYSCASVALDTLRELNREGYETRRIMHKLQHSFRTWGRKLDLRPAERNDFEHRLR